MEHGQNGQTVSEDVRQTARPAPVLPGQIPPAAPYTQVIPGYNPQPGQVSPTGPYPQPGYSQTGPAMPAVPQQPMPMPGLSQQPSQPMLSTAFSQLLGTNPQLGANPQQISQPLAGLSQAQGGRPAPASPTMPASPSQQPMSDFLQQFSQPLSAAPSQPMPDFLQEPGKPAAMQSGSNFLLKPDQGLPPASSSSQPISGLIKPPGPVTPKPQTGKPFASAPFLSLPSRSQQSSEQLPIPGYPSQHVQLGSQRPYQPLMPGYPQLPSQYANSGSHPIALPGYRQPNRYNATTATYPMNPAAYPQPTYAPQQPAQQPQRQPGPQSNQATQAAAWPGYASPPMPAPTAAPLAPPTAPAQQGGTTQEQQKSAESGAASKTKKKEKVRRVRRLHRVPELRQVTAVECGAACLAMILSYYGRATTVSEVQEHCSVGRDGLSALAIVKAARQYGLRVRAVSLKQNDFRFISLPAIIHWEFNHFIVVERWTSRHVDVLDPALGRRKLTHDEFDEGFTGVVVMLEPGVQFEKQGPQRGLSMMSYMRQFMNMPGIIVQIIMASFMLQGLGLAAPFLSGFVIDNVITPKLPNLLTLLMIGIVILIAAQSITTLLRASLLIYLQTHIDARMMLNFFEHLLSLPYRFFQLRLSGDLLTRVNSNVAIRDLLTGQLISTLLDGTSVLVYLVILFLNSRTLTFITLGLGALQVILLLSTAPMLRTLTQRDLAAQGKTQGYMNEILAGISTLKAAGAEYRAFNRWINLFFDEMNISIRHSYTATVIGIILDMLHMLAPLVLLWLGAVQVIDGTMKLGEMITLNAIALAFLNPLSSLASSGSSIQIIRAHFERIADVVSTEPEQDPQQVYAPPRLAGHIELRNVSFQYDPHAEPTLQDISVVIRPGQKVALVGKTGSGKSTLGKLLIGLITPTEGSIFYDGIPLDKLNIQDVRRQFGVVLQESFIFSGSVKENIALNNPDMDMEQVEHAAMLAAIHEDIEKMPMEYETLVAEGGSAFSGGQRQRLALARALANNPAILLLDEATSALDVATERLVEQNLRSLSCTQVVIAHRLSTIRNANLILVLDEGQIVEGGTHEELLSQNGFYANLIRQQLENGEIVAA